LRGLFSLQTNSLKRGAPVNRSFTPG